MRGLSLVVASGDHSSLAVRGPLIIAASLVVEHRLQTHRLSNCGSWTQLLCSTWDLPRPGLEPVSPALAGRFSTTVPPGKPIRVNLYSERSFLLKIPHFNIGFWWHIFFKKDYKIINAKCKILKLYECKKVEVPHSHSPMHVLYCNRQCEPQFPYVKNGDNDTT